MRANVASSAEVSHPAKQALIRSLGIVFDTMVICNGSVFIILTYRTSLPSGISSTALLRSRFPSAEIR
ncbi:MAG: alanine:cation symporter family protein [Candidatus Methanomethylophilaceae archaeon]